MGWRGDEGESRKGEREGKRDEGRPRGARKMMNVGKARNEEEKVSKRVVECEIREFVSAYDR